MSNTTLQAAFRECPHCEHIESAFNIEMSEVDFLCAGCGCVRHSKYIDCTKGVYKPDLFKSELAERARQRG